MLYNVIILYILYIYAHIQTLYTTCFPQGLFLSLQFHLK